MSDQPTPPAPTPPGTPHEAADDALAGGFPPERAHAMAERDRHGLPLYAVVVTAGAALMAFELVGSRLLAPYFGNSIFVWGSLIGVFLAALSLGYTIGGRLSDRYPTFAALAVILAGASVLVALVVIASGPVQKAVVHWNPGIRLNPLLAAVLLFGPASTLMGMVSPFAVRLRAADLRAVGSTAGTLYGLSTMGSIAGTIGTAFWLIPSYGSSTLVLVTAVALAGCSLVSALMARRTFAIVASIVAIVVVGFLTLAGAGFGSTTLAPTVGDFSPVFRAGGYHPQFKPITDGEIRMERDSQYHHIRVVDYESGVGAVGPTRVMHFDNSLQAGSALVDGTIDTTAKPLFNYLRAYDLVPALRPDADRVLLIGLGSGALPMRLHQVLPDARIDVVEIDPAVVEAAHDWFGYDTEAIHTHVGDGRSWLAASDDTYDVIIVDAYFADSLPFHLTTGEFLDVVEDHLAEDGIVGANLIGAIRGDRSDLMRSMLKTYRSHFENVSVFPVPGQDDKVRLDDFANVEIFAADGDLAAGDELLDAVSASPAASQIDDELLRRMVTLQYTEPISGKGVPLLSDDYAPVDALISVEPES